MKRSSRPFVFGIAIIALVTMLLCLAIGFSGVFLEKRTLPAGFWTESNERIPPAFQNHTLLVGVSDKDGNKIKNVWVVVFDNNVAKLYGYTNETGQISFQLIPGNYSVQFEKYHFTTAVQQVTIKNTNVTIQQKLIAEPSMVFGMIPSGMIFILLGAVAFSIIYWNRKALHLQKVQKPNNWFGNSASGSWTFLDKSTRFILYAISAVLLIVLAVMVIPNFPTFKDMSIYYILLGVFAFAGLLIEGVNKKSWIAAIGFGKADELIGNAFIGVAFAFVFIGITGLAAQLCIPSFFASVGSLILIFMVVFVASFFETAFFIGILAPTLAEKTGIIPSIFLTSVLFMFAHSLAYGLVFLPMASAFLFNAIATTIVLNRKSMTGVLVAHIVINAISVLSIVIFL